MTKFEWNPLKCKFATNIPFKSHNMNYVTGNIAQDWLAGSIFLTPKHILLFAESEMEDVSVESK